MKNNIHNSSIVDISNTSIPEAIQLLRAAKVDAEGVIPTGSGGIRTIVCEGSLIHIQTYLVETTKPLLPSEAKRQTLESQKASIDAITDGNRIASQLNTKQLPKEVIDAQLANSKCPTVAAYALGAATGPSRTLRIGARNIEIGGTLPRDHSLASRSVEVFDGVCLSKIQHDGNRFQVHGTYLDWSETNFSKSSKPKRRKLKMRVPLSFEGIELLCLSVSIRAMGVVSVSRLTDTATYTRNRANENYVLESIKFTTEANANLLEALARLGRQKSAEALNA